MENKLTLTGYRSGVAGIAMFSVAINGRTVKRNLSWRETYAYLAPYVPNVTERETMMRKVLPAS